MSESPPEAADRDLLESIGDGDLAAFRVLYDRHAGALFAAARRLNPDRTEAEDILQEVFVAVWRRAESYRPDRGEPMGWLFSILRNKVVDYRRRRSARPQTEELAEYDPPSRAAELTEVRLTVEEALERLRPEERDAVRMTYLAGFTYDEASRALRVPLGTLKSRLKTGLRKLREVFDLD